MPLKKSTSKPAMKAKKPIKQAVAIAYSVKKQAPKKKK